MGDAEDILLQSHTLPVDPVSERIAENAVREQGLILTTNLCGRLRVELSSPSLWSLFLLLFQHFWF